MKFYIHLSATLMSTNTSSGFSSRSVVERWGGDKEPGRKVTELFKIHHLTSHRKNDDRHNILLYQGKEWMKTKLAVISFQKQYFEWELKVLQSILSLVLPWKVNLKASFIYLSFLEVSYLALLVVVLLLQDQR